MPTINDVLEGIGILKEGQWQTNRRLQKLEVAVEELCQSHVQVDTAIRLFKLIGASLLAVASFAVAIWKML